MNNWNIIKIITVCVHPIAFTSTLLLCRGAAKNFNWKQWRTVPMNQQRKLRFKSIAAVCITQISQIGSYYIQLQIGYYPSSTKVYPPEMLLVFATFSILYNMALPTAILCVCLTTFDRSEKMSLNPKETYYKHLKRFLYTFYLICLAVGFIVNLTIPIINFRRFYFIWNTIRNGLTGLFFITIAIIDFQLNWKMMSDVTNQQNFRSTPHNLETRLGRAMHKIGYKNELNGYLALLFVISLVEVFAAIGLPFIIPGDFYTQMLAQFLAVSLGLPTYIATNFKILDLFLNALKSPKPKKPKPQSVYVSNQGVQENSSMGSVPFQAHEVHQMSDIF